VTHPACKLAAGADGDVAQLEDEISRVTRDTARLVMQPGYVDSELWELDERARELRARLRSVAARPAPEPAARAAAPVRSGGGSVSGG
jgi:hypothetical protein